MRLVLAQSYATLAGTACSLWLWSGALAAPANEPVVGPYGSALAQAAERLEDVAARTRSAPTAKTDVPVLRLPPPLYAARSGAPSFDGWLHSQLDQIRREKPARARARDLDDLARALRRAAGPPSGSAPGADPRDVAASVLAQKAYQMGTVPAAAPRHSVFQKFLRWLATFIDWLGKQVIDLFHRLFGKNAATPAADRFVAALLVALVAALAAYLIFLLVSSMMRRARHASSDQGTPLPQSLDPDAVYEFGLAAAARGQYAQAVSLLFRASLAVFDRSGKLPYDGSRTPGEYRHAVRRWFAPASSHFDDIARTFVIAVFAERPISREEFMAADLAYRSMRPLVA